MSLNKTLDRLFDEIRREAKRNPEFADRLDAVLRVHDSRRDVGEEVIEAAAREAPPPASAPAARQSELKSELKAEPEFEARSGSELPHPPKPAARRSKAASAALAQGPPPLLNPVGIYKRAGEAALSNALATQELAALRALVAEHNLDPSGETEAFDRDALAAHVVVQAKRRAERDEKMFDY